MASAADVVTAGSKKSFLHACNCTAGCLRILCTAGPCDSVLQTLADMLQRRTHLRYLLRSRSSSCMRTLMTAVAAFQCRGCAVSWKGFLQRNAHQDACLQESCESSSCMRPAHAGVKHDEACSLSKRLFRSCSGSGLLCSGLWTCNRIFAQDRQTAAVETQPSDSCIHGSDQSLYILDKQDPVLDDAQWRSTKFCHATCRVLQHLWQH